LTDCCFYQEYEVKKRDLLTEQRRGVDFPLETTPLESVASLAAMQDCPPFNRVAIAGHVKGSAGMYVFDWR
jgi:hypothetical protein